MDLVLVLGAGQIMEQQICCPVNEKNCFDIVCVIQRAYYNSNQQ
jgi:hypothetical protein